MLDINWFTKLNMRKAYQNLGVEEGDEDKMVFVCQAAHLYLWKFYLDQQDFFRIFSIK